MCCRMCPQDAVKLSALLLVIGAATAYYVPGTYPQEFRLGDVLQANVNSLKSFDTEMPYEYYTMPFCKPPEGIHIAANTANPGTILEGLRIENSPYNFSMKVKQTGQIVCKPDGFYPALTDKEVETIKHKIDNHYRINMVLDNLPVTVYDLLDENQEYVRPGFPVGYKEDGRYFIHNHLVFNILVSLTHGEYTAEMHKKINSFDIDVRRRLQGSGQADTAAAAAAAAAQPSAAAAASRSWLGRRLGQEPVVYGPELPFYMVVGFEVSPCSIRREAGKAPEDVACGVEGDTHVAAQEVVPGATITYTYDVYWQDSKIKWTSRWDAYLRMPGGKVHWFSIMNSLIVVLIMATIVALILMRTVRRDLAKYEQLVVDAGSLDMKDEAGWKLVTGDAFRAPVSSLAFSVQIGAGVQIILTSSVTLLLATMGFLSPASRGALLTTTMVLFIWLAVAAGFAAVYVWGLTQRTYDNWPRVCAAVSVYFPGIVLFIFTVMNLVIHHTGTSGAVPIGVYFAIVLVWFVISIPLTFLGGYMALRFPIKEHPVKTNQIPRHIPPAPPAAHPTLLFLAAGVLPFGTIFIELYFAMTSIWLGYFYYLFGFVFLIGILTVIINAEISVLCTYVQLCAEDYHWWWQSFHRGGSVALYVAVYAISFLTSSVSNLHGFMPVLIYLCYMTIIILGMYFAMGTIGFLASYCFVYYIFKAIKSD